jgi:hypothetical protein
MADFDLDELEDLLDNTKYNQSRKQADEDDFFGNNDTKAKKKPAKGYGELDDIEQSTDWDAHTKPKTATNIDNRSHPFQGSANQKKNLMANEWGDVKPRLGGSRTS